MARTPLANTLKQILALTKYAEKHNLSPAQAEDLHIQNAISRREALIRGLELAALVPLAGAFSQEAMAFGISRQLRLRHLAKRHIASAASPVVILGAGVAGLTTAYRLTAAGVPCVIYEATGRVGGRMFTQRSFNSDGMFCERGGELVDSDHAELISLCHELGIKIQPLTEPDKTINHEMYFINGSLHKVSDLVAAFKPLAAQIIADQKTIFGKKSVDSVTYRNPFNSSSFDSMSMHDYIYQKKNVDKWVLDLVNVVYTGEYGLDTDAQSAINLIGQISTQVTDDVKLLGDSDESHRVEGGNETLPATLASVLAKNLTIHQEHELVKIADNGKEILLTFNNNGTTVEVKADQVVSAMPFTVLRDVEGIKDMGFTPRKDQCIQKLGYGTNSKMMIGYKSKVWRQPDSDTNSNGLVYSNTTGQEFWETSRRQTGQSGIITSFLGGARGAQVALGDYAQIMDDFNKIFPGVKDQHDGNKVLQHWPKFRFTKGSYSCPLIGQYNAFIGAAQEPELNDRMFFVGEHTSVDFGGFMNGGVSSGNRAAQEILSSRGVITTAKVKTKHG